MTSFYKLSGAGNDFLALVEPETEPTADAIRAWCSRGLSIGADGLFTLVREPDGRARMVHYNADGGRAELCVNGTRCAARLAFHLGWAREAIVVRTDSGDLAATAADGSTVTLELTPPAERPAPATLEVGGQAIEGWRIRVGVPHFVIPWTGGLAAAPVAELGPKLRAHPKLGEAGANVHWIDYSEPHSLAIRSFERGVEAETLACGSGVLAATAVGLRIGSSKLPVEALTGGGFVLRVGGRADGDRSPTWSLTGDARLLATGELLPESEMLPQRPSRS